MSEPATPAFRRSRFARATLVSLLTGALLFSGGTAAFAENETLNILLTAKTGTPAFDNVPAGTIDGKDSGPDDNVIRTNDYATYRVEAVANGGTAENPVVTLTLPVGQEFRDIPAWCNDADGVDAVPTPATMPAPPVPITTTSWETLPQQTLECHIDNMPNSSTQYLDILAWQRSEVPNGTTLAPATATIKSDFVVTPVEATHQTPMIVSAAPQWDLNKNGIMLNYGNGYTYGNFLACNFDRTQTCHRRDYSVLIGGQNGGKGNTPLVGDVTFVDNLTAECTAPMW